MLARAAPGTAGVRARVEDGKNGDRRENPLLRLADYAAAARELPLSPETEHYARRAVIDWFAALFAGCGLPPATFLAERLADGRGRGHAVSYVDGRNSNLRHAALLNAITSHTAEFDDIFRDGGYHPGAPTISAALAAAQDLDCGFHDFLKAVVIGYEVGCRIALAVQPSHYRFWHPTATIGTFGAATAVSSVLQLDATAIAHALATAATTAGGLQQALRGASMAKPMHVGHAADAGCLAALAASAGVTGALEALDGPVGFAAATSEDTGKWDKALAGLGSMPPLIGQITFKSYGCCAHSFAALDAVADLRREAAFVGADVDWLRVRAYAATKDICDRPVVHTVEEARFSLQYCLAALLLFGGVRAAAFAPKHLNDPAVGKLMRAITLEVEPELTARYPAQRGAWVTLGLKDGRVLERRQPTRRGDPDAPLLDDELSDKFRELAAPAIGVRPAEALLSTLWNAEELPKAIPLRPSPGS